MPTTKLLRRKKLQPVTLLIDGDTLIYSAALAAEKPVQWDETLWTLHADMSEAISKFEDLVADIKQNLNAPDHANIVMALSDGTPEKRWRMSVMDTYKSNRKATRRPTVWAALREYVHEKYTTFEREGLEGDDVLGILATRPDPAERIIVSIDKDLKTIPGHLFNYGKNERVFLTEDEADYWHMYQTLTGDRTDGYPGCPGVGDVSARKLLEPCWAETKDKERIFDTQMAWDIVTKAYAKVGLSSEVALQNAQVARILRAEDYDFKLRRVKLWQP